MVVKFKVGQKVKFKTTGRGGVEKADQVGKFVREDGRFIVVAAEGGREIKAWPANVKAA